MPPRFPVFSQRSRRSAHAPPGVGRQGSANAVPGGASVAASNAASCTRMEAQSVDARGPASGDAEEERATGAEAEGVSSGVIWGAGGEGRDVRQATSTRAAASTGRRSEGIAG